MPGRPLLTADLKALNHLTPNAAEAIMSDVRQGLTLRIVASNAGVCRAALDEWLHADASRLEHYNRARTRRATDLTDETIEIADNGANASAPDPARDKLRIQARQWLAARLDRAAYGESRGAGDTVNIGNVFIGSLRAAQPQPVDNTVVIEGTATEA